MKKLNALDNLLTRPFVLLDGAMGTMLLQNGMKPSQRPEWMNALDADMVYKVHRAYVDAGSDIIYTNTFGAGTPHLEGTGYTTEDLTRRAVEIARKACDKKACVALDIGPLGELLEPLGSLSFEQAYEYFQRQVQAGTQAGADLIVIETMTDLGEMRAALLAAKESSPLPVMATMSFEENGRTFSGCSVESMALTLEGLGADAIGINCSLGPAQIYPLMKRLAAITSLPLVVKANAGLPDAHDGTYKIAPEQFAGQMKAFAALGVKVLGGCCGTTPAHIAALRAALDGASPAARELIKTSRVCTGTRVVDIDGVRVIGERINPTGKKRFRQALEQGDMDYIMARAVEQEQAGAQILDVNVGAPGIDEPAMMRRVVKALQSVTDLPLQIDSSNPRAIEAGLRVYTGKAIVNSVNGDEQVLNEILPIVKKYGAAVVGLTLDKNGIPQTAQSRCDIAKRIFDAALRHDISPCDIYIDCLTLTASAQQSQAAQTLEAMRMVRDTLGLKTVLGVSNISFGLPRRSLVTSTFLAMALQNGLALPIVNPNDAQVMDTISAFRVLSGEDDGCRGFIERFAGEQDTQQPAPAGEAAELGELVRKGLRAEAGAATSAMLQTCSPQSIIDNMLIPALDAVGSSFESGKVFLPQLMRAADAACEAFEVIKTHLAKSGGAQQSRGKIVLATVQGDIHDIGKNIVRAMLENYGYTVIDLGRDVAPREVADTVRREGASLVGLSALMTTTLPAMRQTIELLRRECECSVMVGGAVLTPAYSTEIGADFYAKDAKASVDIAKLVVGASGQKSATDKEGEI